MFNVEEFPIHNQNEILRTQKNIICNYDKCLIIVLGIARFG